MTTTIVKVPSTWMVFLPGNRWVNLAQICDAEFLHEIGHLVVTWSSGQASTFEGEQAIALATYLVECQEAVNAKMSQIFIP
ncbi:hypothetical protein [Laspinema olomoucense]|uniref:hypothetical protein n=1 Tax=Laspinema olomoucense TaxID=3231600 RepID=UPI0021BA9E17|nr:hypothetical protein [Laspinema sp. D3a]MCT7988840.1 hypothetical protein [Laspinema sp. D3a]